MNKLYTVLSWQRLTHFKPEEAADWQADSIDDPNKYLFVVSRANREIWAISQAKIFWHSATAINWKLHTESLPFDVKSICDYQFNFGE